LQDKKGHVEPMVIRGGPNREAAEKIAFGRQHLRGREDLTTREEGILEG